MSEPIHRDMIIGEMLQMYPETKAVILRHFGSGCFTCPGIGMESLSFGATMHNVDVDSMVEELKTVVMEKEAAESG
jgi:hybrid cluster-associated redox disulfide protein